MLSPPSPGLATSHETLELTNALQNLNSDLRMNLNDLEFFHSGLDGAPKKYSLKCHDVRNSLLSCVFREKVSHKSPFCVSNFGLNLQQDVVFHCDIALKTQGLPSLSLSLSLSPGKFTGEPRFRVIDPVFQAQVQGTLKPRLLSAACLFLIRLWLIVANIWVLPYSITDHPLFLSLSN